MQKKCSACQKEKPTTEFGVDRSKSSGLRSHCKACFYKRRAEMRQSKFNSIFNGLSAIVKKVYEATPAQSAWDASQIHAEMYRTGASSCDMRTTKGCLDTLIKSGLVKEPTHGMFVRVLIEKHTPTQPYQCPPASKPYTTINTEQPTMTAHTTESPIEKISKLSAKSHALVEMAKKLSADIETVAIEVEDMFSARDAETAKLKQLQALLKSLG